MPIVRLGAVSCMSAANTEKKTLKRLAQERRMMGG